MKKFQLSLMMVIGLIISVHQVQAHSVKVFAYPEGRTISGYGYFTGAGRTKKATIMLLTPEEKEIARTESNEKGEFQFEITSYQNYKLRLDAGEGHVAFFDIKARDLDKALFESPQKGTESTPQAAPGQIVAAESSQNMMQNRVPLGSQLTKADIDQIVARHVRPLREQIETSDEKRRFNDILGSIGYIIGIMGLIAFWQARRVKDK